MKRNPFILITFFGLAVVAVWWLLHHNTTTRAPVSEAEDIKIVSKLSVQRRTIRESADTNSRTPMTTAEIAAKQEDSLKQIENATDHSKDEWRTPIQFFGKVLDENTTPVANANIHFVWTDLSTTGNSERTATSDENGSFSLQNTTGKNLIVKVSKSGYYANQPFGAAFNYAGENQTFVPDANNPVIFRLRKKGTGESLVHNSSRMKIPLKAQAIGLDLVSGKIVSSGEGHLQLVCSSNYENRTPDKKFDWRLIFSVPKGGVLEAQEQFDFEAPETGYRPAFEIGMPATMVEGWQDNVETRIFLKLSDGHYARISFSFVAYNGVFRFESFMNPTGSRNLEPKEDTPSRELPPGVVEVKPRGN